MTKEGAVVTLTPFDQSDTRATSEGSSKTAETSSTTISTLSTCLETRAQELPSDDEHLQAAVTRLHRMILDPIPEHRFVDAAQLRNSLKKAIMYLDLFVARREPEEHSRLKGAIQDVAECLNVKQNSDHLGDVADLPDWYAKGEKAIRECSSLEQFKALYQIHVVPAMDRLRQAQGSEDPKVWALEWAIRMRSGGDREDWALNWSRKLCLEIVFKLYDWCERTKTRRESLISRLQVVLEGFGWENIGNILKSTVSMDRAQVLYVKKYPGASSVGMHWVAEQHVESDKSWKQRLRKAGGSPTINKRLITLTELKKHDFGDWLKNVVEPCSVFDEIPATVTVASQDLSTFLMKAAQFGYLLESQSGFASVQLHRRSAHVTFCDVFEQTKAAARQLENIGVNLLAERDKLDSLGSFDRFDVNLWKALLEYHKALSQWQDSEGKGALVRLVDDQGHSEFIYNMLDRMLLKNCERIPSLKMNLTSWLLATILASQLAIVCLAAADITFGHVLFPRLS